MKFSAFTAVGIAVLFRLSPAAYAQQLTVKLSGAPTAPHVSSTEGITESGTIIDRKRIETLHVQCTTAALCSGVSVQLKTGDNPPENQAPLAASTPQERLYAISGALVGQGKHAPASVIDVLANGTSVTRFQIANPDATAANNTAAAEGTNTTLTDAASLDCRDALFPQRGVNPRTLYVDRLDSAMFRTSVTGTVASRPRSIIDEDDRITVRVIGDQILIPQLRIFRKSATRNPDTVRVAGAGIKVPSAFKAQSGICDSVTVTLTDFAPGEAEVGISALTDQGSKEIGSFKFAVDPLYSGMLSFGAARTTVRAPAFKAIVNGNDTTLSDGNPRNPRYLLTLFYTHFLRKRDFQKEWGDPWGHLNPTIGIALNEPTKNLFGGISFDVANGIVLTAGEHAARVDRLDPASHLIVGGKFSGDASKIPTVTRWTAKPFLSLSFDLRAVMGLLTAVASQ